MAGLPSRGTWGRGVGRRQESRPRLCEQRQGPAEARPWLIRGLESLPEGKKDTPLGWGPAFTPRGGKSEPDLSACQPCDPERKAVQVPGLQPRAPLLTLSLGPNQMRSGGQMTPQDGEPLLQPPNFCS